MGQCIMSSPMLAAYSFMVEDRKCAGIPSAEKEKFQREEERCVRKEVLPSKVYDIFTLQHHAGKRRQTSLQHVTQPKEIVPKEMPFFCCPWTGRGAHSRRWPGGARGLRALRSGPLPTLPLSMSPGNARKQDADNQKTKL